jgi:hypothetical protein
MPRLVSDNDLLHHQRIWLNRSTSNYGENVAFHDDDHDDDVDDDEDAELGESGTIHARCVRGGDSRTHFVDSHRRQYDSTRDELNRDNFSRQVPVHPLYSQQSEPLYGVSYQPPPGPDNRSTIFRGRGGAPTVVRNEYDQHQRYYHHQQQQQQQPQIHHPHYQSPLMHQSHYQNSFLDEHRQDTNPLGNLKKRDHAMAIEIRTDKPQEPTYYHSPYSQQNTAPLSLIPYFEPDETPHRKRPFNAPVTPAWNNCTIEVESKGRKGILGYPYLGEKLTWQQSYENLQVYKKTYGVSCSFFLSLFLQLMLMLLNH